jgi:hypothetical protein
LWVIESAAGGLRYLVTFGGIAAIPGRGQK